MMLERLNFRVAHLMINTFSCIMLLVTSVNAATFTVKAGGGGDYTTIQACASATAAGDTCTVYAGTYNENVTVPTGGVNAYKTINVNGTDIVSVTSFTLASHTKLVGNCSTAASMSRCGFSIGTTAASPTGRACVSIGSSTDVFVVNNVMTGCGSGAMISDTTSATNIYIQGNTLSYACVTATNPTGNCHGINDWGNYSLVENNDLSHYQLGTDLQGSFHIYRNNTFHDQLESEAGSNGHSDTIYMEPNFTTGSVVMEGNLERNAVGPNAKGFLTQNDSCTGSCTWGNIIARFNTYSRLGSAAIANDKTWPKVKVYNNTFVDEGLEASLTNGGDNMLSMGAGQAVLNSLWFESANFSNWNPYACSGCTNYGYNLYWCTGTCTSVWGHHYGSGTFLSDPGNKNQNPLFVNYISPGNSANDYHLQAGSPAIGAGTFLTTVAASDSGSGTSLVLSDVSYFQDGYGLAGVQADCIAVGTASNRVCITSINYGTNTVTLASSISRSASQGVYLYSKSDGANVLTGTGPDLGAYPFSGSGITPPTNLVSVVH